MKRLLIIISIFMVFMIGYGKTLDVNVEQGAKIPNFELKNFRGVKTKSRKIFNNGKPTLFVVAAEWCPHCQAELPELQKFYDENKNNVNVVVVFISNKSSLLNTKQYVENNNFTFPVYYDFDKSILKGFKVKNVPFNLKIRNSIIEESSSTIMNYDDFNKLFSN